MHVFFSACFFSQRVSGLGFHVFLCRFFPACFFFTKGVSGLGLQAFLYACVLCTCFQRVSGLANPSLGFLGFSSGQEKSLGFLCLSGSSLGFLGFSNGQKKFRVCQAFRVSP